MSPTEGTEGTEGTEAYARYLYAPSGTRTLGIAGSEGVATCHFVYLLFPADSDLKVRVRLISVMQASTSAARAKSVKSV